MLKFIFCLLLAVNIALFALGQGYFGNLRETREPARMKGQLHAELMTLTTSSGAPLSSPPASVPAAPVVTPAPVAPVARAAVVVPVPVPVPVAPVVVARAAMPAAVPAPPPPVVKSAPLASVAPAKALPKAPEIIACTEVGNFTVADARRFDIRTTAQDLSDSQSRHYVPGQEVTSYIVHIPPQASKEAADKKAIELKQLGVENYFIMSENSPMRWAISLGVFKLEAGAQTLLASLQKQGVHSAKVSPRYGASKLLAFQFHDLDGAAKTRLEQIKADFPAQEIRACK
ncbi:hypothetical protein AAKU55_002539 [Oxalobacteraceae bacterium GrIS 1.11]